MCVYMYICVYIYAHTCICYEIHMYLYNVCIYRMCIYMCVYIVTYNIHPVSNRQHQMNDISSSNVLRTFTARIFIYYLHKFTDMTKTFPKGISHPFLECFNIQEQALRTQLTKANGMVAFYKCNSKPTKQGSSFVRACKEGF